MLGKMDNRILVLTPRFTYSFRFPGLLLFFTHISTCLLLNAECINQLHSQQSSATKSFLTMTPFTLPHRNYSTLPNRGACAHQMSDEHRSNDQARLFLGRHRRERAIPLALQKGAIVALAPGASAHLAGAAEYSLLVWAIAPAWYHPDA